MWCSSDVVVAACFDCFPPISWFLIRLRVELLAAAAAAAAYLQVIFSLRSLLHIAHTVCTVLASSPSSSARLFRSQLYRCTDVVSQFCSTTFFFTKSNKRNKSEFLCTFFSVSDVRLSFWKCSLSLSLSVCVVVRAVHVIELHENIFNSMMILIVVDSSNFYACVWQSRLYFSPSNMHPLFARCDFFSRSLIFISLSSRPFRFIGTNFSH